MEPDDTEQTAAAHMKQRRAAVRGEGDKASTRLGQDMLPRAVVHCSCIACHANSAMDLLCNTELGHMATH